MGPKQPVSTRHSARRWGKNDAMQIKHFFQQLSVTLQRGNAARLVDRDLNIWPLRDSLLFSPFPPLLSIITITYVNFAERKCLQPFDVFIT